MKNKQISLFTGIILMLMLINQTTAQSGVISQSWSSQIQVGDSYMWEIVDFVESFDETGYNTTGSALAMDQSNVTVTATSTIYTSYDYSTTTLDGTYTSYSPISMGSTFTINVLQDLDGVTLNGTMNEGFNNPEISDYFQYMRDSTEIKDGNYFLPVEILLFPVVVNTGGEISNYFEESVSNENWGIFADGEKTIVGDNFIFTLSEVDIDDGNYYSVSNATGSWDISSGVLEDIIISSSFKTVDYWSLFLFSLEFIGMENTNPTEDFSLPIKVIPLISAVGVVLIKRRCVTSK